jgi:predicted nucleotidyltransferase
MNGKNATIAEVDELLRPPSEQEVEQALMRFATEVRRHYGDRVKGIYLFGSRARGDHEPESDADVAIVLEAGDWIEWVERRALNAIAYEPRLDSGLAIQPWPFSADEWAGLDSGSTKFAVAARRHARPIGGT